MRQYLQALPLAAEFAIVVLGAFGLFFLATLLSLLQAGGAGVSADSGQYSGEHLVFLVMYELPIGAALFWFLRIRGWSLKRLGIRITAVETLLGFPLVFFAELACYAAYWALAVAAPGFVQAVKAWEISPGGFGLATVIVASIVNPIFEETFVSGYVISVLKERADVSTAITISTAIRLLYHLYQGPIAFAGIIPVGLVFAWWYARTGRLWPVIVAHGLGDFIAFVGYAS
jgi:membrane protease YdiL (CAAX protease family)